MKPLQRDKLILYIAAFFLITGGLWLGGRTPSNNRAWTPDQAVLPRADIAGDEITLYNIRNNVYRTKDDYDVRHYDKTVNIKNLTSVDYFVVPFDDWRGPAHTFLSFGFQNDDGNDPEYVAISVEIRKGQGEKFSPWRGLFRQYELMYVVSDERDVVKLRTDYRDDPVYRYPVKATPAKMRALFLDMIARVNKLHDKPEFYNTITNNCTSNLLTHVNAITPGRLPWSLSAVFPAYSDTFAYQQGLLDIPAPPDEIRERYRVQTAGVRDENFSQAIRAPLSP